MPEQQKLTKGASFDRTATFVQRSVNEDDRTVELAFSSEEPYERWFGTEVLDHSPESVRLDRLNNGAAVLVDHDRREQVGVVISARIDDDKVGRATVKFSRSAKGKEIFQDVVDGIRSKVSVGYSYHKWEVEERKGEPDLITMKDWEPHEISIVSIPADDTVGVGRSKEPLNPKPNSEKRDMAEPNTQTQAPDAESVKKQFRSEEAKRFQSIRAAAGQHEHINGVTEAADKAIEDGTTADAFRSILLDKIGEHNTEVRKGETEAPDVDLSNKDAKRFSMIRLMDHLADPNNVAARNRAQHELEVCSAAADKLPAEFNVRGAFVPTSIMHRDLSVGNDGALVGTDHLGGSFIEVLRNNMVAMQMGVRMLTGLVGNVDIPRQLTAASATWISAEGGNATESEATFGTLSLTPKDLAVYTDVTRRLRQQSSPSVDALITQDLAMAHALKLDSTIFYGSGSSGEPQGINGATGVLDPTFASATAPTYAELITMITNVLKANTLVPNTRFAISADTWDHFSKTPKQTSGVEGNFILNESISGLSGNSAVGTVKGRPVHVSNQLADDDFVFGDFSQVLIGEWGGYELNLDPAALALSGGMRFITFKTCDIGIRHGAAFSFHDAA